MALDVPDQLPKVITRVRFRSSAPRLTGVDGGSNRKVRTAPPPTGYGETPKRPQPQPVEQLRIAIRVAEVQALDWTRDREPAGRRIFPART